MQPGDAKGAVTRCLGLFLLLTAIAWAFRLLSIWRGGVRLGAADLRGLLADAVGALLVSWCAVAIRAGLGQGRADRWMRGLALLPSLAWAMLLVAAHEQVRSLGSPLTLDYVRYLGDPTFLVGSALRPVLLGQLALVMVGAGSATWWLLRDRPSLRDLGVHGCIAILAVVGLSVTPVRQDAQAWRQTLVRSAAPAGLLDGEARSYREPDLKGPRWIEPPTSRPDVLLLVLEGVSGASLPTIASAHGIVLDPARDFAMTRLDEVARDAVTMTSFVTEQRQTNRGMYALLCGQSPRLRGGEARLTEISRALPHPACLPELLSEVGYRTVFFEATPLPFMFMDTAMPRLGFQSTLDDSYFQQARARNSWGVDDKTFLLGSLELIEELDKEEGPWFLTLLTAGTHHPYDAVPDDFVSSHGPRTLGRAMAYLDEAVGEFLSGLDARSRDLLLVVASDESAGRVDHETGAVGDGDDLHRELSQNWGVLIFRMPEHTARRVDEPVLQSEVALSVLDFLDLADSSPSGPGGRSLFRTPASTRVVAFGNTYQGRVSGYDASTHRLLRCPESLEGCQAFQSSSGSLFGDDWSSPESAESGPTLALLNEVRRQAHAGAGRAQAGSDSAASGVPRSYVLASPGERPIQAAGHQLVFGGQYLEVPAGSRVTVDLAAEVVGRVGWAHVRHALSSSMGAHFLSDLPVLSAGDSFALRYTFATDASLARLDARMLVDPLQDGDLSLRIVRARLDVEPDRGGSPEVEVLDSRVERRSAPPTFRHSLSDGDLEPGSGLAREGAALVWRGTGVQGLISGPKFYAPAGSTLRIRALVESTWSGGMAGLLLGSEEPSLLLASSEMRSLAAQEGAAESVELRLEHHLTATLNELVTGLRIETGGVDVGRVDAPLVLRTFDVEVSPP